MVNADLASVKAQLRLTAIRLGQLQERKNSEAQIIGRDIATLLQQGNVELARAKAQKLIQEDSLQYLYEILKGYVGIILEHFNEIEVGASPGPTIVEAASSILFAAPRIDSKDLMAVREQLVRYLGNDFAMSAIQNRDSYVSPVVMSSLSATPSPAAKIDEYLSGIAETYGVKWTPEFSPQEVLNSLSEILDPTSAAVVDLSQFERLCLYGIPDGPSWFRPRVWKLLFGVLPVSKLSWKKESTKQRNDYYELIRRLLSPLSNLPSPTKPLSPTDTRLLEVSNKLDRVPHGIFSDLESMTDDTGSGPLENEADEAIRLSCSRNLDTRLQLIHDLNEGADTSITPEIRLQVDDDTVSGMSLSNAGMSAPGTSPALPTLLHSSHASLSGTHMKHVSALRRMLYVHQCLNPKDQSPHLPSLLVTLYSVLLGEFDPEELAHVEPDTFWLFEAVVSEFSELEDEESSSLWLKKFSDRVLWADADLANTLQARGLDPVLPHFSYRWLAPLLVHTLPLPSVLLVWDVLFSRPMRQRSMNPKLDYLLDICTGMLIRVKPILARLGKPKKQAPSLWADEDATVPPPSPLRAWEIGDAFMEGISLLQIYPLVKAGGIARILQTAAYVASRRQQEEKVAKHDRMMFGNRFKVSLWKGFTGTNETPDSPDPSSDEYEESSDEGATGEGNDTEIPANGMMTITSKLASTVWRGITNQSSMDVPPSPQSPLPSPAPPSPASPVTRSSSVQASVSISNGASSPTHSSSSSIWGYADKLKASDAAANLAKVSTNWRAKAIEAWSSRANSILSSSNPSSPIIGRLRNSSELQSPSGSLSLPTYDKSAVDRPSSDSYSPPPRPAFFKSPRDSMLPHSRKQSTSSISSSPLSPQSDSVLLEKSKRIRDSLAPLTSLQGSSRSATPKFGPRPLLLGSSPVVGATKPPTPAPPVPILRQEQRSELLRNKHYMMHRDSQSSISSLAPSDVAGKSTASRSQSGWDSDSNGSRIVPLNRRSVSPMAPHFAARQTRWPSTSSSGTTSEKDLKVPPYRTTAKVVDSDRSPSSDRGWGRVDMPDSPQTLPSPPVPRTPINVSSTATHVLIDSADSQSLGSSELKVPALEGAVHLKTFPTKTSSETDDSSDSSVSVRPRTRTRRPQQRLELRIRANSKPSAVAEQKTPSPNTLAPEWPSIDVASTPRATTFDKDKSPSPRGGVRKLSSDGSEVRVRKVSHDGQTPRTRKISTGNRDVKHSRDSAAEEGDDEGYDDLLSAYESEDSLRP